MAKEKSNLLMFGVLVIAVAALVLGAVALNKANMTGNAFWDNWFKQEAEAQENVQEASQASSVSGGGCDQPDFDLCVADCKSGNPDNYDACMQSCGETWCEEYVADAGLLGMMFLEKGGSANALNDYRVKYDGNGNMIYEIIGGIKLIPGENYEFVDGEGEEIIIRSIFTGAIAGETFCKCVTPGGGCSVGDCYKVKLVYPPNTYLCDGNCYGGCECKMLETISQ